MANSIRFIVPGTNDQAVFPSAVYPRRAAKTTGEDLLDYLYPYPLQNRDDANLPTYQKQQKEESGFEKLTNGTIVPRSGATGPPNARDAKSTYTDLVTQYQNGFYENSVTVYQRAWCATHAGSERPLIATCGIVLCVFVLIYDPTRRVAVAAHIDEDQNSETIIDVIPKVFPDNAPLDIYFIGGRPSSPSMEEGTRKNLTGQLGGLFGYCQKVNRQMTIRMFDVIGRTHYSDITFDTRDGAFITNWWGAPPTTMGNPLDSLFRYWPSGQYWAELGGSELAVKANELIEADKQGRNPAKTLDDPFPNKGLTDYLATVQCQWDGTEAGWPSFYAASNDLICRLTIEYAFSNAKINPADVGNVHDALITRLKQLDRPMMLEQSLKRWCKWSILTPEQQGAAGKAAVGSDARKPKEKGEASLTWAVAGMLKDMKGVFTKPTEEKVLSAFDKLLPAWVEKGDYAVPWEGRH